MALKVTARDGIFVAEFDNNQDFWEQLSTVKGAKFRWHGGGCKSNCPACGVDLPLKKWWTNDTVKAARLADICDDSARALLEDHIDTVEASKAVNADIDIPCPKGKKYRPFQKGGIAYALERESTLIGDEMGLGKRLALGTPILTPDRWVPVEDLQVGDLVIGKDGRPCTVTGTYYCANRPLYRITFNDNTTIDADDEHLWTVQHVRNDSSSRYSSTGGRWRTMTTSEILAAGIEDASGNRNWRIPLVSPVEFQEKDLYDPYTVGVVLGDGSYGHGDLWVVCTDKEILDSIDAYNRKDHETTEYVGYGSVRLTCLEKARSWEKQIPSSYLFASIEQRKALLAGLVDTDGHVNPSGTVQYSTSSFHLADDMRSLVQSLGGTATICTKQPSYTYKGENLQGRKAFVVTIRLGFNPFRLTRKATKWNQLTKYQPTRIIKSIERIDNGPGVCISVDSEDRLYVAKDYIVTHNTIQALGIVNATADAKSVLCVVPASLRLNWLKEALAWIVDKDKFSFYVVEKGTIRVKTGEKVEKTINHRDGTKTTKMVDETVAQPLGIPEYANFVIVNYDLLSGRNVKNPDYDPTSTDPEKQKEKVWKPSHILAQLMARTWDVLVVDEAHYIKNPNAARTKAIIGHRGYKKKGIDPIDGLTSRASRKIFMTGTPILNRPIEIQPLLGSLAPQEFGNFFMFARRYCDAHQGRFGWDFSGASNLEELQERLRATVLVRRLKRDVLKELPPKVRQVIPLPQNGAKKTVQAELAAWQKHKDTIDSLENAADFAHASGDDEAYKKAVKALNEARQVAFSEMSRERANVAEAKIPAVVQYLEDAFDEGVDKIVLFGHHHVVCNAIKDHFGDAAVRLTGEDPNDARRQAAVDRFQEDPTCKLFVGSIKAAGVGHTLTAASHVIFAELDWTPANLTQAEDRAHRIGKMESVLVQHLVFDGSLDARMAQMCVDKQDVADRALDKDTGIIVSVTPSNKAKGKPRRYPVATDAQRAAAHTAMKILSAHCDGALAEDGQGFNKLDTSTGKKLAALNKLTDGQVWLATRFATKYRRQLPDGVLDILNINR